MAGVILSASATPPLITPTPVLLDQWSDWKTALLASGLVMKLASNNITVTANTTLADLVECVSPGYLGQAVTVLDGPDLYSSAYAYMSTPLVNFTTSGGGTDIIYVAYLCQITGAPATVTFTLAGGAYTLPVITSGGSGYLVPPIITPTGATGSGAILQAVITGGVLTGVTIVAGGTGYTTVTAVVEAPLELVQAGNLPTPLPLIKITDAVNVVMELQNLAV